MLLFMILILRNIICLIALIVISPLLFLSALLIIFEDGLPIFFTQERIGLNKKVFKIETRIKTSPVKTKMLRKICSIINQFLKRP